MTRAISNQNAAEKLIARAESDTDVAHAALLDNARHLAKLFTELVERLERDGVDAEINPDGIVQGRGTAIDVACSRFMGARRHLGLVRRAFPTDE